MSEHTQEPWSINTWPRSDAHIAIGATGTPLVALIPLRDVSINGQKANARRVVACVNACAGIPDPTNVIPALRRANERLLKLEGVERQRDQLVAALRRAAATADAGRLSYDDNELRELLTRIRDEADAAIARETA